MTNLNYDKFINFIDVFERRNNLWISDVDDFFRRLNENFNQKTVQEELKKYILESNEKTTIKFRNSQITTFCKALINYLKDDQKMISGYTTLSKFCKNKTFRLANIKQLLQEKKYLIKSYATEKAFISGSLILTIKHQYRKAGLINKFDLLFLWKESFLLDLVSRNKKTIMEYELDYKYRTPRNKQENLNEIYKYTKLLYYSEFIEDPENEINDILGEYPFLDFLHGNTDIFSIVEKLSVSIPYKFKLLKNTELIKKFQIEFKMLVKYLKNYERNYS